MRRRDVIALLGGTAAVNSLAVLPFAAWAQANKIRTIAWLGVGGPGQPSPYLESLRDGLRELGWVEGRNLKIGTYWATGLDDMAAATQQALASDPEVVVTQEFMAIAMLLSKAPKPVVFGFSGDPVDAKLAQSWARPGGNFTGMSYLAVELVGKRIELLKEWLPDTRRIAVLARPQHPGESIERKATEEVVKKLGMEMSYFPFITRSFLPGAPPPTGDESDLDKIFRAIIADRCDALVVFPDSSMFEVSERVANFAHDAKLPSVSGWYPFAQKGLLMTYGPNVRELYRSLARYTDRILKGTRPADLPVEVPAKFYLAINLKTAKALGIAPPARLLTRADEVIE
ncbi:MAG TPA: ABC transporter substrate-binding protein [Pseudolabrys sp.]|jgi:putative ABC transport system substrate-binding protein|nr:ABC transporter substrate-binding protein [Pseudolabrys sp.]